MNNTVMNKTLVDANIVTPSPSAEITEIISTKKDGKTAEKLYENLNVLEVTVEKPENVICEYVPQTRLKKSLGRLECLKTFPAGNEDPSLTHYRCQVKLGNDMDLSNYDQSLFEQINISEEFNPHGYLGYTTFSKTIGRFHCDRMISERTQKTRFECGANLIYSGNSE